MRHKKYESFSAMALLVRIHNSIPSRRHRDALAIQDRRYAGMGLWARYYHGVIGIIQHTVQLLRGQLHKDFQVVGNTQAVLIFSLFMCPRRVWLRSPSI